jgi:DNA-directed RNA polymerase subunit RPC12/RpoP
LDYDDSSFEVEYKCTKCKTPLKQIEYDLKNVDEWEEKKINLANYSCPKCGKYSLYEDGTVITLWD